MIRIAMRMLTVGSTPGKRRARNVNDEMKQWKVVCSNSDVMVMAPSLRATAIALQRAFKRDGLKHQLSRRPHPTELKQRNVLRRNDENDENDIMAMESTVEHNVKSSRYSTYYP